MNVLFYIAKRHLFAKKKQNAVNIITSISIFVVIIVTAAMILILSAFNGLESLVLSFYSSIEPDVTISPVKGKNFELSWIDSLSEEFTDYRFYPVLKEDAIAKYDGNQTVATIVGVTGPYLAKKNFAEIVRYGAFDGTLFHQAFPGLGIMHELQIPNAPSSFQSLQILFPIRGKKISKSKDQAFTTIPLHVGGSFSINAEYDSKYIYAPYIKLADKSGNKGKVSQIAVITNASNETAKAKLKEFLPKKFKVTTRKEENRLIYETTRSEKWFTFIMLLFICCIAAFNIVASIAMLIIDKRQDIRTFLSIGLSNKNIAHIFILEGMLINLIGIVLGLGLGVGICLLQQTVGLVPLPGGTVPFYPVEVQWLDILFVALAVFSIGIIFTYIPIGYIRRKNTLEQY